MIRLERISKRYRHPEGGHFEALAETSLTINAGEVFGLIGYSGAGKSTLLRTMNLLERPDTGSVTVDGEELTALSTTALRHAQRGIGMVFQQFNLLSNRTVAENIAFPLEIAGWSQEAIRERVAECLDIVQLSDRAAHYPAQLSGGQKQRVGIARALAPRPKVILADEPTSALDPRTTRSILDCLKAINRDFGVTIVLVTHDMQVIRAICHRAALLDQGRLVEVLAVQDGEARPTTALAQSLLEV
ncbi:ATP-binding cassette domain-containing protein [bacterium]|nr:ATP-binding cassette domain-containing protein [bacterium]